MFDLKNIILLIIGLANFVLALFIFAKNKKNKINISFSLFTLFVFLWTMGIFFYRGTNNDLMAIYLLKSTYISAIFIGVSWYYFSIVFPENKPFSSLHKILIFLPSIIISALLLFPNFLTKEIIHRSWGKEVVLGKSEYIIFFSYFIFLFVGGVIRSWKKYFKISGTAKTQLLYIIISVSVAGLFGMIFNLILPSFLLQNFRFIWVGPIFTFLIVIMTTYAVLRYRLMDIKLFFGRGAVYFFSFASAISMAFILMMLNDFYQLIASKTATPMIIAAGILTFNPFFELYEKFASRYFYYKFYNYQTVLTDLSGKLNEMLELEKLAAVITDTLVNNMHLDKTGILIRDPENGRYETQKIFGFHEENGISLVKDNFLTEWLAKTKKPVVREELFFLIRDARDEKEKESFVELERNMKKIEADMCLPMIREDKIIGIIVLGKKLSEEPYSKQDIDLLTHLANQASIALENARLYKKLNELSKNLENKVNEQVADIKELLKMKSEFLTVVNHQLRTPVSIIKGMSSMLVENSMPQKNKEEFIKKVYYSSERLATILDDILIAEDLIGKTEAVNFEPVKIEEIIEKAIKHFEFQAAGENIRINFKKTGNADSLFLSDKIILEKIIERLLDNAILYTSLGGKKTEKKKVLVSLNFNKDGKEENEIIIKVKDEGIGLNEQDKKNLFKLFKRGERSIIMHPNGSGLGLFIVKNLVDRLQGKIDVQSEGEEKGAEFTIILPYINKI